MWLPAAGSKPRPTMRAKIFAMVAGYISGVPGSSGRLVTDDRVNAPAPGAVIGPDESDGKFTGTTRTEHLARFRRKWAADYRLDGWGDEYPLPGKMRGAATASRHQVSAL